MQNINELLTNNSCLISDVNNSYINSDDTCSLFTTVCYCCDMVLSRERKSIGEIPSNAPRPQHRDIVSTHKASYYNANSQGERVFRENVSA